LTEADNARQIDQALALMAQKGVVEAEETLIAKYVSLVRKCARPYFLSGGDSEDLIQEGMLGLLSAVRHYTPDKGAAFKTYAELCIRRRIYSAIRKFASPMGVSVGIPELQYTRNSVWFDFQDEVRDPEALLIDKERSDEFLRGFYSELSRLERNILKLYLKGAAYREIAKKTGKSTKSVDNAIQRVRHKLRSAKRKESVYRSIN
jgi:RNA polymerase sporulation-specific sigma factor